MGWDEGRSEYQVKLKEILTLPLPLLTWELSRSDEGWQILPATVQTIAAKRVSEGASAAESPVLLTHVPGGWGVMDRFVSHYTLRLDAKGRVSIPAPFRAVLTNIGSDMRLLGSIRLGATDVAIALVPWQR